MTPVWPPVLVSLLLLWVGQRQPDERTGYPTADSQASAERAGWPYLVMTQRPGTPLDRVWPTLQQHERCAVLRTSGRLAAEVHALPLGAMPALAPRWPHFL